MDIDIYNILANFLAVTVGLFALWSFVGGMRRQPASTRARWALLAGIVSGAATLAMDLAI